MNTYDQKIRKKVLIYRQTHNVAETSRKFEISRQTIYTWEKQAREGYVKPASKTWFKKIDPEKLRTIVTETPICCCTKWLKFLTAQ